MIAKGANVNIRNNQGNTPLHLAIADRLNRLVILWEFGNSWRRFWILYPMI
ncbi:hypothetical protein [Coleofasciculus sp. C1-SOL-03]|uniref:hypothetical protein n=1 Tax=Coleofasciculus sp. C1-SOL-03 TaxID=3069522 RepID=UPI0040643378